MASKRMKNGSCRNRHAKRYRHIKQQSTSFRAKKEAATPRVDRENVMNNAGQHANWPLLVAKPEDAKMAVRRWKTPAKQGCRNGIAVKKKAGQKKDAKMAARRRKAPAKKEDAEMAARQRKTPAKQEDAKMAAQRRKTPAKQEDAKMAARRRKTPAKQEDELVRGCQNGSAATKDAGQTRG